MKPTLFVLCQPLYGPSDCFPVTNLEIKHGKDTVWLIFFPPYPLKLPIYEEKWEMSWSLPSATLLPLLLLLLYFVSPRHTHTPLPVSLCSPGASGKAFQSSGHCRVCIRGKERDRQSLSVLDLKHSADLLCLQHLSFAFKAANLFSLSSAYEFELRVSGLQELFPFLTS